MAKKKKVDSINPETLAVGFKTGAFTLRKLPNDAYYYNANKLTEALYNGFGKSWNEITYKDPDFALLKNLRENTYRFSAAKTFQEAREITDALVKDNTVVPFSEFKDFVETINERYNVNWLGTEYNTAQASGQSASAWARFEDEKETLPNLRYSTIGDACPICEPLNGIVLPVDDPFWDDNNVPQHFNCACILEQEEGDIKPISDDKRDELASNLEELKDPMFNNNVGKSEEVFTEEHPYFSVPNEYAKFMDDNFGFKIPAKDQ